MAFDGVVARAVARELNDELSGSKIEKIYQPEKDELVFSVHNRKKREKLFMSCNPNHSGIYISNENYENPANPSSFCMLMRKHLQGGIIRAVKQKSCDRIIELFIESYDELGVKTHKKMIIEVMGKHSNLLLTDEETGKIIDTVKRTSLDNENIRQLIPGFQYEYPDDYSKLAFDSVTYEDVRKMLAPADERNVSDVILSRIQGISPVIARELSRGADELIAAYIRDHSEKELDAAAGLITENLTKLNKKLDEKDLTPAVYKKDSGVLKDFHVVQIAEYSDIYVKELMASPGQAASYFYSHRDISNRIKQKQRDILRRVNASLKKLRLKEQRLQEDLLDAKNSDKYRLYGEILTANLHVLKQGEREVTLTNYYDNSQITIPMNENLAPSKNAQRYFKKYSKAKRAIVQKKEQIQITKKDISYLESVADAIERAESMGELEDIKTELIDTGFIKQRKAPSSSKKNTPHPFSYKSSTGYNILAGRNNKENDYLTFKVAGKKDIWLHTKDIPGSHVILFSKKNGPDDKSIYEAACIAAFHSKARNSENVPVDYTEARFVKKPNGAKPGMVIFTDNRTLYVNPKLPLK